MTTTFFSAGGDQSIKLDHRGKLMLYICVFFFAENSRIYKLEKELVTVKTERLLVLETEKEELKNKCKSLEEQLQFWPRTLQDSNLERSGYDERSGAAALSVNEGDNIRGKKSP